MFSFITGVSLHFLLYTWPPVEHTAGTGRRVTLGRDPPGQDSSFRTWYLVTPDLSEFLYALLRDLPIACARISCSHPNNDYSEVTIC